MNEPNRTQWEIRCAFNGFCKKALKHEASNAHRDVIRHQMREVTFSDMTPEEESQLYTVDRYSFDEETDKAFHVAGKRITPKLLAEALRSLPDEKREAVLLYYFFDMSDVEIAKLNDIPRSTVQYRRATAFDLLKRFLEERAYDMNKHSTDDERGLLPYPVIIAATKGDPEAMNIVVRHYESYAASLSMRKLRDERGNTYFGVDEDIRDRLRSHLIRAVLDFKP